MWGTSSHGKTWNSSHTGWKQKKRKRKRKGELGVWSQGWLYSNVFLECKEISVPCVDVRTILVLRAYSWVCRPWDAAPTSKCIQIDGQTDREQRQLRGVRDSRSHSQRQAEVRGHRGECLTLLLYLLPVKEISVYYKVFALESDSSAVQSKVWNTSTYIRARTTVLSTPPSPPFHNTQTVSLGAVGSNLWVGPCKRSRDESKGVSR